MSTPATPREVFESLVHGVSEGRMEELPELYAEDAMVVHPFMPAGPSTLEGRDQLREHFLAARSGKLEFRPRNIVVHETSDPEVIVAEFEYHGQVVATGEPFTVPNIFVMRVRDGLIVWSRDYANHLAFAQATGVLPELYAALAGEDPG